MRKLIEKLHRYDEAYNEGAPLISDEEYDKLYFELKKSEKETGIIYPDSPTQSIHYTTLNQLTKVKHEDGKMLSLDKTNEWNEIRSFVGEEEAIISLKLDGLSCRITYENGVLVRAETRGDGEIGEDVTHNIKTCQSVPQVIPYKGKIAIDGEILCKLDDFEEFAYTYKNARNFAAGSLRLLDSKECSKRKLTFFAWSVISNDELDTYEADLHRLSILGFQIVPCIKYSKDSNPMLGKEYAKDNYIPIDGLVVRYNSNKLVEKLGETSHHKRGLLAYKFAEESYSSYLRDIVWNPSRNGRLTPVAIFDPIEIDGTTVSKASLHNITIMQEVLGEEPYIGEEILVQKSKEIIPQVIWGDKENVDKSKIINIPNTCPICGGALEEVDTPTCTHLTCKNPECEGSFYEQIENFVSKKGLDIKGLSKKTIEKLYSWGWLKNKVDIFKLENHKEEWVKKPGFGVLSVNKVLKAIEESKNVTLDKFIASLGISLIGGNVSKEVANLFDSWEDFRKAIDDNFAFVSVNGFGYEKQQALLTFDYSEADELVKYLNIEKKGAATNSLNLEGLTFVITGKLKRGNRAALQSLIEENGGKVTGSVSSKTNYLINNDVNSTTGKNKKAKELNVPIISEQEFYDTLL